MGKIKKTIIVLMVIILAFILFSKTYALESEQEEEFTSKTIQDIKEEINGKNNKELFMLTTQDDIEKIAQNINDKKIAQLNSGYNSLANKYNYIINSDAQEVEFTKPLEDYDRNEKIVKKNYTVVLKNEVPEVLFLYKINKIWSKEEGDEFYIKSKKYEEWIKKQVLAVCDTDFQEWYYGSFLNVGEVAYGVSLTYNWMYDDFSNEEIKSIENAIIKYAINVFCQNEYGAYFTHPNSNTNTNRNQVINSSMGMCALVLMNSNYQLIKVNGQLDENGDEIDNIFNLNDVDGNILKQGDENIIINLNDSILKDMIDDNNQVADFNDLLCAIVAKTINLQATFFINKLDGGGYPEGLGYYRYGMSFTTYFVSSLHNLCETDFDITNIKGLYDSLLYPVYIGGNSNKIFNYGDTTEGSSNIGNVSNTGMIWFANYYISKGKTQNSYLLYKLELKYRFGLYNIIWYKDEYGKEAQKYVDYNRDYLFENISVATINKSLDTKTNDIYIATKAGKVERSHGDLDIGSFIFDALGERWIEDFGLESYTASLIDNFRYGRWNYYKKRAEGHSTFVINPVKNPSYSDENDFYYLGADQYIYANAPIEKDDLVQGDDFAYVTMDITDAYNRQNKNKQKDDFDFDMKVQRTIGVYENRSIAKIKDVFRLDKERNIYSFLNVASDVTNIDISEDGQSATLNKENGKKVRLELSSTKNARFEKMNKVPLNDFLNDEEAFSENLTDKDKEKLYVNLYVKNVDVEIKIIPQYIYNVEVKYSTTEETEGEVIATITADERMQRIEGWDLSEDEKTLTKTYTANTKEDIKILDIAGNETVKTVEINNIVENKELEVEFNSYSVLQKEENKYIANIEPNTTVDNVIKDIVTNGNISIYKNNNEIINKNAKVETGMKVLVYDNNKSYEFIIVVMGDLNGDGDANIRDILAINKYRLGKANLENKYLLAGDVNKDNIVDIRDIMQINKFRLGKINTL